MFTIGLKIIARKYPAINTIDTVVSSAIKFRHNNNIAKMEKRLQMKATRDKKRVQRMNDITTK